MCNLFIIRCLAITFSLTILIASCKQTSQPPADENDSSLQEESNNLQINLTGDTPLPSEPTDSRTLTKAQSLPNLANTKEEENNCGSKDSNESSCFPIRKLKEKAKSMFSTPTLTKENQQGSQQEAVQEQSKKEELKDKKKTKEEKKKKKQEEKLRKQEKKKKKQEEKLRKQEEKKKKQEKEKEDKKGKEKEKKSKKEKGDN